ncbi:universal stress protein [Flagellimonas allohymeniacidonis]|uniref:Universal stress protein n=1 Tax=Flagellimonas allohymeniacidonis TaxID=2517819 RepID=A0A4V2HT02_9FLAO|nr:universal stress protein [Allomuricauda hymeniacidonis]TAI49750.1 universal stress protein [Allomuricauda hymeniacidonis]
MKKILLPTDFSKNSYNAAEYALRLFKDEPCLFYLMHTYTPPVYHTEYVMSDTLQMGLGDFFHENTMEQLSNLQNKLEGNFKNPMHQFKLHGTQNLLVDEVREMVGEKEIDLIVMGTQGATGAKELLFGSNTVHVLKKATCPVIAVPDGFEYENPKEILFPTDYEIVYREKGLKEFLHLAYEHVSRIEVLHIARGHELTQFQKENKSRLEKLLRPIAHVFHEIDNNEIIAGINEFQLKNKVNLLVMVMNKHTFLEQLFIKPVIKKISLHLNIPFMVIPYFK